MNRLVSLTALLGERCCTDADTLQRYGLDWTRFCQPAPLAVLFPQIQEEVQEIVRIANREGLQLVPSGGRTGLSGGACATAGEVVVSLERMNRLLAFDATDRLMTVEAGMVTETLQQLARERGLYFPVDFASRGSSQVGWYPSRPSSIAPFIASATDPFSPLGFVSSASSSFAQFMCSVRPL